MKINENEGLDFFSCMKSGKEIICVNSSVLCETFIRVVRSLSIVSEFALWQTVCHRGCLRQVLFVQKIVTPSRSILLRRRGLRFL